MSFWGAGANKRNRNRKMRNRASVYADVNQHRPREYWNYEALTIQWGYVPQNAAFVHALGYNDLKNAMIRFGIPEELALVY